MTEPSLVGTIAACPRCNSMVQIDRPQPQIEVGGSEIDSQAITEDAIAAPDSDPSAPLPPSPSSGFEAGEMPMEDSDDYSETSPPPPDWQNPQANRSRQIALVLTVSLTGLLAATIFFVWFVKYSAPKSDQQAQTTGSTPPPAIPPDTAEDPQSPPTQPDRKSNDGQPENNPPVDDPAVSTQTDTIDDPKTSTANPSNEEVESPPEIPSDLIPPSILDPPVVGGDRNSDDRNQADNDGPDAGSLDELPEGLRKYLGTMQQPGPRDLQPTIDAPPTLEDLDIEAAAENDLDPALALEPPEKINVKANLSIQIALDSQSYPLADLTLMLSHLASAPIQLDWVSFDLCGIDVHQHLNIPRTKLVPAHELLQQIAESVGAEVRYDDWMAYVTPSDERFDAAVTEVADLSDFGAGEATAIATLNQLLGGDQAAANTELQIGPTREDKQFAMLAIESLRRLRKREGKIPDALLGHWAQIADDHSLQWQPVQGGQTEPQRTSPIALADWIRRLSKLNGASCVMQWQDAVPRDIGPAWILIPANDSDAGTTLRRLFDPHGMQVRLVDPTHWWIGAPATYDRAPVIVWSSVLQGNAQSFRQRVESVMPDASELRFAVDPVSDRALILLPRYIAEQLPKIEASLAAN